jgi:hypothetical protein
MSAAAQMNATKTLAREGVIFCGYLRGHVIDITRFIVNKHKLPNDEKRVKVNRQYAVSQFQ